MRVDLDGNSVESEEINSIVGDFFSIFKSGHTEFDDEVAGLDDEDCRNLLKGLKLAESYGWLEDKSLEVVE